MHTRSMLALTLFVLLAGCVSPLEEASDGDGPATEAAAGVHARLAALLADVPCEADVPGDRISDNLLEVAHVPFREGRTLEMDLRDDLLLVARYQLGGLEVLDVRDPAAPATVGVLATPGVPAMDVKWLPDGRGALIGNLEGSIQVVDLTDPAEPTLASTYDYSTDGISGQAHMLWVHVIDGTEWVFVPTQRNALPMHVFKLDGWDLEYVTSYGYPGLASGPLGNHDVTVYEDPELGIPVLYLSDGLLGWQALDVSDPANPVRIGGTLSAEPGIGYTHTVRVVWMEEKRVVVTMSEVGMNTLKVYDATDLAAPVLLGSWRADATRPHIPQHNIQVLDGLVYMAHYTEGLYVLDIRDVVAGPPLVGQPAVVAHFPVQEPAQPSSLGFANMAEVLVKDGVVYASDSDVGLYVLGFGCLTPGDEAATSTY